MNKYFYFFPRAKNTFISFRSLFLVIVIVFGVITIVASGDGDDGREELGSCTVDCAWPFTGGDITSYTFISEDECRSHADAQAPRGYPCKVTFCPPTGNEDDCYRVYNDNEAKEDNSDDPIEYTGLTTSAIPPGDVYNEPQEVTLVVNNDISPYLPCILESDYLEIETYYTTDGSIPTTSSILYTGPILIDQDTTLMFFSVLSGGCEEETMESNNIEFYDINE